MTSTPGITGKSGKCREEGSLIVTFFTARIVLPE
jgi:hypothetical protein